MPSNPSRSNSCRFEGCTLTGALTVTTSVRDSVTVVHGPAGCAHHNFSLLHSTGLDHDCITVPHILSSGLLDTEIIFGGEKALGQAIESAVSRRPKSVFVLSTCIAETIGDDVTAVCGSGWDVPVIPIPTAGFLGGSFQAGVNNALTTIAGMAQPCRNDGGINIIGEKNLEYEVEQNYAEVVRLLSLLGLPVNLRFIHNITTSEIMGVGKASLNILRDEGVAGVGERLFWQCGTPFIPAFPTGLLGTIAFLDRTADACGMQSRAAVLEELASQESMLDDFSDIAGSCIAVDHLMNGGHEYSFIHDVTEALHIRVKPEGTRVPLPLSAPVGTAGVRRMLHRWRRAIHA
jgi:nitrogenase molybdenum-iron protein alpha/beta subunit